MNAQVAGSGTAVVTSQADALRRVPHAEGIGAFAQPGQAVKGQHVRSLADGQENNALPQLEDLAGSSVPRLLNVRCGSSSKHALLSPDPGLRSAQVGAQIRSHKKSP
jgi:hypothetical protein